MGTAIEFRTPFCERADYPAQKSEVQEKYPNLHFFEIRSKVYIRGTFPIVHAGKELDRFSVEVGIPPGFSRELPVVQETGRRIPPESKFHVNPDGTCCVLLPDTRYWTFPIGSTLLQFFDGPLYQYFLGASLVLQGESWPFGEWDHGGRGVRDFYAGLLETKSVPIIAEYLRCLASKKMRPYWDCPCGSRKQLRFCHGPKIHDLRAKIPPNGVPPEN